MIRGIGESIGGSWYQGQINVLLKMSVYSLSFALHNMQELVDVLIAMFGSLKQILLVLTMYTNVGPEHHTKFLSAKIGVITLQQMCSLDHILGARTAIGHSF